LTEEEQLAAALAKTKKKREQEQLALQAKMHYEKAQIEEEQNFAAKALEVASKAASAPKPAVAMRQCPRCDKDTPAANNKCEHCSFQASMFGGLAF
jgi:hypothetical protein